MPMRADIIPEAVVVDPHRESRIQWGWYRGRLWNKKVGQSKWTRVSRVSFTPSRFLAIASIIPEHYDPDPHDPYRS